MANQGRLNWSPRTNWVERRGGLPDYVERIAVHLIKKGFDRSHAIATAINTVKKWCASGEVHQWPGTQRINAKSMAGICASMARWEAMKNSGGGKG